MIAFTNATIMTMNDETIKNGTIIIDNKKITAVGQDVTIPAGCKTIDTSGKYITPGLIDAHTHLGINSEGLVWSGQDYEEKHSPITPQVHVRDSFYPFDIGLHETCSSGVTTVMVTPGSDNPIGGQCMIVKTRQKPLVEEMILKSDAGLKIAFGENPRKYHGSQKKTPMTRMGIAALLREHLQKAREYMAAKDSGTLKSIDLGMEATSKVLRREMPLRAHAHRVDDIVTAVRIAEEFNLEIIIEHGTEGHLIADWLAEKNIAVAAGPLLKTKGKMEIINRSWLTPAAFEKSGVKFALISDHPFLSSKFLPVYAGLSVRFGLSVDTAMRAMTIEPARMMHIDDRVGSLEVGKDADLVIWSGHPLDILTHPEQVIIDGAIGEVNMQKEQLIQQWID